jgi:hypothetical protein
MQASRRRTGIRLDGSRIDHELAVRGISAGAFCEVSGIAPATLSRARHGGAMREGGVRALATALEQIPVIPGIDALVARPGDAG